MTPQGPILLVGGTRPEVIKLGPVFQAFGQLGALDRVRVVLTGQHVALVQPFLEFFALPVHRSLNVMVDRQSPTHVTISVLREMESLLAEERPACVVVQGDTTSAMAAAIAAHYAGVPVAHVEAGLRSDDLRSPFPEEFNRRAISAVADVHFAPTVRAGVRLRAEGHPEGDILVTGNTSIDALYCALARIGPTDHLVGDRTLLVTAHRRENHAAALRELCLAILRLVAEFPRVRFRYPVHPNPAVRDVVHPMLSGNASVLLENPLGYVEFVRAMRDSYFIVTDSGGVQEEAPALGKPVLIFRDTTERPEAVEAGVAKLVGTRSAGLYAEMRTLLVDPGAYARMTKGGSPYGDGGAGLRIVTELLRRFSGTRV